MLLGHRPLPPDYHYWYYRADPIKRRISISRNVRLHAGQIKGSSVINTGPIHTPGNAGPDYQYTQGKFKTRYSHVCGSGTV